MLSQVEFTGEVLRIPVSEDMLGRIFNGSGKCRQPLQMTPRPFVTLPRPPRCPLAPKMPALDA